MLKKEEIPCGIKPIKILYKKPLKVILTFLKNNKSITEHKIRQICIYFVLFYLSEMVRKVIFLSVLSKLKALLRKTMWE